MSFIANISCIAWFNCLFVCIRTLYRGTIRAGELLRIGGEVKNLGLAVCHGSISHHSRVCPRGLLLTILRFQSATEEE